MKFHDGTWDFFKLFIILLSAGLFLFWLRHDFGANVALIAVILCAGTVFFIAGSFLSAYIQKSTMDQISKFNAQDATIDRFRMQSLHESTKAETYKIKLNAQKELIDYKQSQRQLVDQRKQELKQLTQKPDDTFWESNDTVDLKDWS